MTINLATKMLEDSAKAIGERQAKYGPPNKNFKCIAELWTAYLRGRYGELATIRLDEADVALMSDLIKTARLAETPDHEDSWVDKAGYSACGRQVTAKVEDDEGESDPQPTTVGQISVKPNDWWSGRKLGPILGEAHIGLETLISTNEPTRANGGIKETLDNLTDKVVAHHAEPDPKLGDTDQMQTTGPLYEYDWNTNQESVPPKAEALSQVIDGDPAPLMEAFLWRASPQGFDYWGARCGCSACGTPRKSISNEDRLYLMWLRDEAIKRQKA